VDVGETVNIGSKAYFLSKGNARLIPLSKLKKKKKKKEKKKETDLHNFGSLLTLNKYTY
jgi:hypothetical protein